MNESLTDELRYLERPDGRISYTVTGDGPLIVAVPGMGDLRATYRDLVPPLLAAGYRVAVTDVRGHGDSDTSFRVHGDEATGRDLIALIDELGGPAVIVGNSMGASSAAWAAAERPDAVAGLVLISPFLRDRPMPKAMAALLRGGYRALLSGPWGPGAWAGYYSKTLNRGTQPSGLAEHVADIRSSLKEPGRLREFRELAMQLDHGVVEARIDEIRTPAIIVVGELDPDYADPAAELAWMGEQIDAEAVLVPDAAHYPQTQRPELVSPPVVAFLDRLRTADGWRAPRA
jgi:pimeloyl-ACP methyl ester carboxylesterase